MCSADCAALAAVAAEFRTGGFDLFAAELDTLAARVHKDAGETVAAGECTARAQADLQRAGNPWTPIVDVLGERGSLTDRQREICGLVVAGLTNAQIATELGISKRTVENQLHRSYTTLGVDRAGLSEVDL
ncbi:MAG: LuxR C-terminal-related transcriptional regulator [Microthrixaceae bacterium]